MYYPIDSLSLSLDKLREILQKTSRWLVVSEEGKQRVQKCRTFLETKLAASKEPVYGINTGFGSLCNTLVAAKDLQQLQLNLIRSHACGTGSEVPSDIVRLMLILKVRSLAFGYSGVQLPIVEKLLDFYNHDFLPVVYTQGSLGASGDLSPLAHLCLPLLGEGDVRMNGKRMLSKDALEQKDWLPLTLKSKEGLALLNGTQFMLAYGVYCVWKGEKLLQLAHQIAALSIDGFDCKLEPFQEAIHRIRPHKGQSDVSRQIRLWLSDSEIATGFKNQVQDPYSFRCIPQVHGACQDALQYVKKVMETEFAAATDNPNIFPDEGMILSGGNFHGQPLAMALDYLAIVLAEIGSISERRTYQLISGQRGLPPFLTPFPGLNSGLMIPQYTAASIVSQNKQLCTPASIDTIPSSNNQEDHVSMGANAATKCYQVLENLQTILAIELINASQAVRFREPAKTGSRLQKFLTDFRKKVPFIGEDRYMHEDIQKARTFIEEEIGLKC